MPSVASSLPADVASCLTPGLQEADDTYKERDRRPHGRSDASLLIVTPRSANQDHNKNAPPPLSRSREREKELVRAGTFDDESTERCRVVALSDLCEMRVCCWYLIIVEGCVNLVLKALESERVLSLFLPDDNYALVVCSFLFPYYSLSHSCSSR